MTYHFYLSVGKFPKLFNFSGVKKKSYLLEWNKFKENAFYDLQKILLDSFSRNKCEMKSQKITTKLQHGSVTWFKTMSWLFFHDKSSILPFSNTEIVLFAIQLIYMQRIDMNVIFSDILRESDVECMLQFVSYLLRFHLASDWSWNNKHSKNFLSD